MVTKIYDKGGCVGCPTYMGCLGASCPYCWEYQMICDKCGEEVDELLYSDDDPSYQICKDCLDEMYHKIEWDNNLERFVKDI